jgi:hypothetical protein
VISTLVVFWSRGEKDTHIKGRFEKSATTDVHMLDLGGPCRGRRRNSTSASTSTAVSHLDLDADVAVGLDDELL